MAAMMTRAQTGTVFRKPGCGRFGTHVLGASRTRKTQTSEAARNKKAALKSAPYPQRRMISSAASGPNALAINPATPMIPMERARLDAGARSEQIGDRGRHADAPAHSGDGPQQEGKRPGVPDQMEKGRSGHHDRDSGQGDLLSAFEVDLPAEERPDHDRQDAVDSHDQADAALGGTELAEEEREEEEKGYGHEEKEVAQETDGKIAVPESRASIGLVVHGGWIVRPGKKPVNSAGIGSGGEVMLAVGFLGNFSKRGF